MLNNLTVWHVLILVGGFVVMAAIAVAMGVSEATVSRLLSEHLDKFALMLAHAGLRVVGQDMRCFPPDYVDALLFMAKQHLSTVQTVRTLEWD